MAKNAGMSAAAMASLKLTPKEAAVVPDLLAAASLLSKADAVLVVAGAGMSGHAKDYNVYVDPKDFARAYPGLLPYGFNTAYECMGLMGDHRVPDHVKAGYLVGHMQNQRYGWPVNEGYAALLDILRGKDYFVHTSNVDGHFLRAGFDPLRLYRPQGDWERYQCLRRCRDDAIWDTKPLLDAKLPLLNRSSTSLPKGEVPRCKHCGGPVFGNVRGGDWFIHAPYAQEAVRERQWLEKHLKAGTRLAVLEVGAGFNTPTVTRWPGESVAREGGAGAALVRLNPTDAEVPTDLPAAVGLGLGWQSLDTLRRIVAFLRPSDAKEEAGEVRRAAGLADEALRAQRAAPTKAPRTGREGTQRDADLWKVVQQRWGHFDWRVFMQQLERD
eukprot:Hpha_TRINITY_DN27023_c0_g1::TRINITY_DN27023_c0_g1_i1::g.33174::m.33174